eukprot:gene18160-27985_t
MPAPSAEAASDPVDPADFALRLLDGEDAARASEWSKEEKMCMLGDALISSGGYAALPEAVLRAVDCVYDAESPERAHPVTLETIVQTSTAVDLGVPGARNVDVRVWRGDITKAEVGVIVNAANSRGLGCFMADHRCVDNVIHRAAGPRLREACRGEMARRKEPLAAGTRPIATPGFHLPAKAVLHVTGPELRFARMADGTHGRQPPTAEAAAQLAACYELCLAAAADDLNAQSIAFPCLSTGLFGYPSDHAAAVVLATLRRWLSQSPASSVRHIILSVFTDKDEAAYQAAARDVKTEAGKGQRL